MQIQIQNTRDQYKKLLALPEEKREAFFNSELLQPFASAFERLNMPMSAETLGCIPITGNDAEISKMLFQLEKADVWNEAYKAIETAAKSFEKTGVALPDSVQVGIFLGSPLLLAQTQGYSGMGSVPGYIQIILAPNDYNLPRLNSCIAHEFHHNVYFFNAKWNFMNVTVGKYLAVEGLAESFAAELYGKEFIGPWVTGISEENLEKSRKIIGNNLDVQGFMEVRKYMYGDHPMVPEAKKLGIPFCGGYAAGYHAVQAYLQKAGVAVAELTNLDGDELMRASGYFD